MGERALTPEEAVKLWRETTPDMPVPPHLVAAAGGERPRKAPPFVMCCYGDATDAESFTAWCEQRHVRPTVRQTHGQAFRIVRKKEES